jgi:serine O-acetyltransferase
MSEASAGAGLGSALPAGDRNANPADVGIGALLAEDFRTHGSDPLSPGFWALAIHRFGNWRMDVKHKLLRGPLTLMYLGAHHGAIALWGIDLPYNAKIGRRFRIVHHGAVFIGSRAIGDDVTIRHTVTIGLKRKTERLAPVIGNRIEIGPGACIVGEIEVGDDSTIGANTVVAQNVPAGSTILGVPGRFIGPEKN